VKHLIDDVIQRLQESAPAGEERLAAEKTVASAAVGSPAQAKDSSAAVRWPEKPKAGDRIGRYRIVRILGSGGMGFVFKAEDVDLERPVALKVMRPELARDPAACQRFLREARAAAALKHDHIVTIYQVGQEQDVPFLAMEFLEGESLETRLKLQGKFPVAEVLRIGREIAMGLGAAHEHNLIHRDIKPANIWLEGGSGRVKILDFGLARLTTSEVHLTSTGMVMGTPEFMAPEQARGAALDQRCDLFNLGAVLYVLCSGDKPFQGTSAMAVLTALAVDTPIPIRERNPEVPPALAEIIERLLAKEPASRPASAGEVASALAAIEAGVPLPIAKETSRLTQVPDGRTPSVVPRSVHPRRALAVAAGIVGLILAASIVYRLTRPVVAPEPPVPPGQGLHVIAVLPFVNSTADQEIEHLGDGIPGAILHKLSHVEHLTVRPYNPGTKKPAEDFDLREVGRKFDVDAVLTGRFRLGLDALLLHVELVDVRENRVIFIEQYERRPADLQDVVMEIVLRVCAKLGISLTPNEERRVTRRDTPNADAYQLYLRGRHHALQLTLDGLNKSVGFYRQAIASDPKYALAHAGLADAYGVYAGDWMPYEDALPKQKAAAAKALQLDDDLGEAHLAMGNVYMGQDYDWPAAEKELKCAIELKPKLDLAHDAYAQLLAFQGRFAESMAQQKEALDFNPRSPYLIANLSYLYYLQRQYDKAIEQADKALEIDPDFVMAHDYRGAASLRKAQFGPALDEFRKCRQLDKVPWYLARLAAAHAVAGNQGEALKMLKELQDLSKGRYVTPECYFLVYVGLGEKEQAFAWLQKMYDVRSQYPLRMKVQPDFDSLRDDPRFAEWLRRLKLTP
jgi:serine/threonine-protein kinase